MEQETWGQVGRAVVKVGVVSALAWGFMYQGASNFDTEWYTWSAIVVVLIAAEALGLHPLKTVGSS